MKFKIFLVALICLTFLGLVEAVPQIIVADFNLTIWSNQSGNTTNGVYHIIGEGGELQNTFPINGSCNFNYELAKIPLRFSREIAQNETDVAVLIRALTINNNVTYDLIECKNNLSWCLYDSGYKANFTTCNTQLEINRQTINDYSQQIKDKNVRITQLNQRMWLAAAVAVICAIAAVNFYKKSKVRTVKSAFSEFPTGPKIN